MATELQANIVQWGSIVFSLDNEAFRKDFESGRRYYFVDANEQRNFQQGNCYIRLRCLMPDRVTIVLMRRGIDYLEEYLGVFLGYMSGPLPVSAITKE